MILDDFGNTYLPMSGVFYTMPITLVRFLLRYLPTPKLDILYGRSLSESQKPFNIVACSSRNDFDPLCHVGTPDI